MEFMQLNQILIVTREFQVSWLRWSERRSKATGSPNNDATAELSAQWTSNLAAPGGAQMGVTPALPLTSWALDQVILRGPRVLTCQSE